MSDDFNEMSEVFAAIQEAGYDPDVIVPLFDLVAESAMAGVQAAQEGDTLGSVIAYGRVSGIFDALLVQGYPVPADTPADVMLQAEAYLADASEEEVDEEAV